MELMPGYKQSEVGPIPSDWDLLLVSELANVDPENLSASTDPNYSFNYISLEQVDFGNLIGTSREVFRTAPSRARRVVRHDDVLMSTVRPNLKAHLHFRSQVSDAICSTGFAVLRAKPDAADPAYIFAHLFASPVNKQIEKTLAGSNYPAINSRDVRELKIPCPPTLREQGVIAQALSDVDALLATLDQVIAKKRDLKQAAMQQLLTGETRLPGFSGNWEMKHLGEIAHIKTGSRNNEDKVEDGQYPFFVRSEFVERINSYSHDCEAILVPGEGRIGDIFHYINGRFDVHQRVYAITKFSPGISGRFVYFYLSKNFGAWAMQNTVKATVDSLRLPTFQTFEMRLPPTLDEQIAIANALSDIDGELCTLENRRDKINNLKQAMMQELLTGKTRLV